jgi:hypothetical protein
MFDMRRDDMPYPPAAAVVSACRSDPVARTYGSPVSHLLAGGVRAVLGSYLPLTEPHATGVAARLLVGLRAALDGDLPVRTWGDIVWWVLRSSRAFDVLIAAASYLSRKRRRAVDVPQLLNHHAQLIQEGVLGWAEIPKRLREVAEGTPFAPAIKAVVDQNLFRPESMFYTHVGEPDRILVGPTWQPLIEPRPPKS